MIAQIIRRIVTVNNLPTTVTRHHRPPRRIGRGPLYNERRAHRGVGGVCRRYPHPAEIRRRSCVGDTICAGGILYGQRGIAAMLDFCRDIRAVCAPGALLRNYANPMAMMTWAAIDHGGVTTVGLCHGVQN